MRQFDLFLFGWLAAGHHPSPWLLPLMSAVAVDGPWASVAILGWVAWRQPAQRAYLIAVLAACAAAALLAHAIAGALNLPRPFMLGLSPTYIPHGARGSLPSAHASVMFTFAIALFLRPGLRLWAVAATVVAFATGWARVYVGVHFPTDIAAGLLLGAAVAGVLRLAQVLVLRAVRRWRPQAPEPTR